ncbi:MAG: TIM44-like domain-containing protein [Hyphomicrobiales bacterium]|nr:TIM44-like domain-containing protein [Hyphomicrobiales bacterium]
MTFPGTGSRTGSRTGAWLALVAFLALVVVPTVADARFSRSGGFGSRGSRTFTAPRTTPTAPRATRPIQQTRTPRSTLNNRPATTRPGLFGGMSRGGFMAGLLGAGLLGALFGYGLSGGLGGIGAFLGLLAQVALLVFAAMFLFSWLRRRNQPQTAMGRYGAGSASSNAAGAGMMGRSAMDRNENTDRSGLRSSPGGGFATQTKPLATAEADFTTFERLLNEIQIAYAREDMNTLRRIATEEMCAFFQDDIDENQRQGQESRISNVKLLQGDLSEAWKERDAEYATVAMRFSLNDAIVDRKTGKVIEGSLTEPHEMTEIWTFVRQPGGTPNDWKLSAVQPVDDE